jgi:hypothetical protein
MIDEWTNSLNLSSDPVADYGTQIKSWHRTQKSRPEPRSIDQTENRAGSKESWHKIVELNSKIWEQRSLDSKKLSWIQIFEDQDHF